jgi:enterobacterial common antigen flippase
VALLLALPGILATVAFSPWIIRLLYSSEFGVATEILCWQMAGILLRVVSQPLGMILVAKGANKAFFWTEFASAVIYLGLAWLGLKYFGLPGTGMAFIAAYAVYWVMIVAVVGKVAAFRWSGVNIRFSLLGAVTVALALLAHFVLEPVWSTVAAGALSVAVGVYCLKILVRLVGAEKIRKRFKKYGLPFPWSPAETPPRLPP